MIGVRSEIDDRVLTTLRTLDPLTRGAGRGVWQLTLLNGRAFDVEVKRVGAWLSVECRPERHNLGSPWQMAQTNARLARGAKLIADARGPALRVDVPCEESEPPTGLLLDGCGSLLEAWTALHEEADGTTEDEKAGPNDTNLAPPAALVASCAEAGWPAGARAGGSMAVDLEAPGFWQAIVTAEQRGLRASVELAPLEKEPLAREATATLLLEASGHIRLARAAARGGEASPRAVFEVLLRHEPDAAELARAFEVLSVACRLWAHEVKAVQDETVARCWLATYGTTSATFSRGKGDA
jgi:hypothetical protein